MSTKLCLESSSGKKQKSRKRKRISWAQLLKCTFKIDVLKCDKCGGLLAAAVPLLAAKGTAFTLIFFELALHRLEHFFLAFVY
jgi:hypothetical protein